MILEVYRAAVVHLPMGVTRTFCRGTMPACSHPRAAYNLPCRPDCTGHVTHVSLGNAKVNLHGVLNKDFRSLKDGTRQSYKEVMDAFEKLEPFPSYEDGKEREFKDAMTRGKKHEDLAVLIDKLQGLLKQVKGDCEKLNLETKAILPEFDFAEQEAKRALTLCWMSTAVKILLSKAASNLTASLK